MKNVRKRPLEAKEERDLENVSWPSVIDVSFVIIFKVLKKQLFVDELVVVVSNVFPVGFTKKHVLNTKYSLKMSSEILLPTPCTPTEELSLLLMLSML